MVKIFVVVVVVVVTVLVVVGVIVVDGDAGVISCEVPIG